MGRKSRIKIKTKNRCERKKTKEGTKEGAGEVKRERALMKNVMNFNREKNVNGNR